MSKGKYTRGDWRIDRQASTWVKVQLNPGESDTGIASCGGSSRISFEEQQANAILIAAAPELLEALKNVAANGMTETVMKQVYLAISKAEGKV